MHTTTLTIELPDELLDLLGSTEAAGSKAREALILQLLREGEISQGKAARLLGITRYDILDLMSRNQIPSGPRTPEEIDREIERAKQFADEP